MPLFLLLWPKETLARRMPAIFKYDVDRKTLVLRGDVASAPWLHFVVRAKSAGKKGRASSQRPLSKTSRKEVRMQNPTRSDALHGRRLELDADKPWWYCTACHAYWIPRGHERTNGEAIFASDERVPMRNFLEGYFPRWHVDTGFP